jgi:hypothetical protein
MEATLHLAAILGRRLSLALAAAIERDDGRANVEVFAAEPMILLAVESRVAQNAIEAEHEARLSHGRAELRRIVARSRADGGRSEEMAGGVTDDGQLRPVAGRLLLAGAGEVVTRGVLAVEMSASAKK